MVHTDRHEPMNRISPRTPAHLEMDLEASYEPQDFFLPPPIPHVTKITDGLFVGSRDACHDMEFLISNKILGIINCVGQAVANLHGYGVHYLTFRWLDQKNAVLFDAKGRTFARIHKFIEKIRAQGGSILIHSVHGISRACLAAMAYFIRKFKWSITKCLEFLQSKRPEVDPKPYFLRQLHKVARQLYPTMMAEDISFEQRWMQPTSSGPETLLRNTFLNAHSITFGQGVVEDPVVAAQRSKDKEPVGGRRVQWLDYEWQKSGQPLPRIDAWNDVTVPKGRRKASGEEALGLTMSAGTRFRLPPRDVEITEHALLRPPGRAYGCRIGEARVAHVSHVPSGGEATVGILKKKKKKKKEKGSEEEKVQVHVEEEEEEEEEEEVPMEEPKAPIAPTAPLEPPLQAKAKAKAVIVPMWSDPLTLKTKDVDKDKTEKFTIKRLAAADVSPQKELQAQETMPSEILSPHLPVEPVPVAMPPTVPKTVRTKHRQQVRRKRPTSASLSRDRSVESLSATLNQVKRVGSSSSSSSSRVWPLSYDPFGKSPSGNTKTMRNQLILMGDGRIVHGGRPRVAAPRKRPSSASTGKLRMRMPRPPSSSSSSSRPQSALEAGTRRRLDTSKSSRLAPSASYFSVDFGRPAPRQRTLHRPSTPALASSLRGIRGGVGVRRRVVKKKKVRGKYGRPGSARPARRVTVPRYAQPTLTRTRQTVLGVAPTLHGRDRLTLF